MKKNCCRFYLGVLFLGGLQFLAWNARAQSPLNIPDIQVDMVPVDQPATPAVNPLEMSDSIRGAVGNILTLIDIGEEPELGALINVSEGTAEALIDGDESYIVDEGTGSASGSHDLKISSYDYIKEHVLDSGKKTAYTPLNDKIAAGGDMEQIVKDMFFIDTPQNDTDAKQLEIMRNRAAYLKAVSRNYTNLAYTIQTKLIDDMDAISADINGNGSIGAIAGLDQTWKAVNKALIADIAMQIQLIELDAAKFLSIQPFVLMSKDRQANEVAESNVQNGGNNS